MVASATAMKFSGVGLLATRTPRAEAAGMSILSVPMKGTMTSPSDEAASITPRVIASRWEARITWQSRAAAPSSPSEYAARPGWSRGRPMTTSWPAARRGSSSPGGPLGPEARTFTASCRSR